MLTPEKHLDLDTSVLRVSSLLLKELQRKGVVDYEKLRHLVERRTGTDGSFAFMPALNVLFLLGLIDYHVKNDTVEYRSGAV